MSDKQTISAENAEAKSRRQLLGLTMPVALTGLLAACGRVTFGGSGSKVVTKTVLVKKTPAAEEGDGTAKSNDSEGNDVATATAVGTAFEEPTPVADATPDETPAAVGTVNPLVKLNDIDITSVPKKSLFSTKMLYGTRKTAMLVLSATGLTDGDTVLIVRRSGEQDPAGRIIASRKITALDISTSVVFDNLNFGDFNYSDLLLIPKSGCGLQRDGLSLNIFQDTFLGKPVIDAQTLITSPDPNFYTCMPNIEYTNPLTNNTSPNALYKQRVTARSIILANANSTWGAISMSPASSSVSASKYIFKDALGNDADPSKSDFLQKNQLLVVYYPIAGSVANSVTGYYRYFFFFG